MMTNAGDYGLAISSASAAANTTSFHTRCLALSRFRSHYLSVKLCKRRQQLRVSIAFGADEALLRRDNTAVLAVEAASRDG